MLVVVVSRNGYPNEARAKYLSNMSSNFLRHAKTQGGDQYQRILGDEKSYLTQSEAFFHG